MFGSLVECLIYKSTTYLTNFFRHAPGTQTKISSIMEGPGAPSMFGANKAAGACTQNDKSDTIDWMVRHALRRHHCNQLSLSGVAHKRWGCFKISIITYAMGRSLNLFCRVPNSLEKHLSTWNLTQKTLQKNYAVEPSLKETSQDFMSRG